MRAFVVVTAMTLLSAALLWVIVLRGEDLSRETLARYTVVSATMAIVAGSVAAHRQRRRREAEERLVQWVDRMSDTTQDQLEPTLMEQWPRLAQHLSWAAERFADRFRVLKQQSIQHQRVVNSMVDGVVVVNSAGRVIAANPAARRLLGVAQDDLHNRPLLDLVRIPEIVATVSQVLQLRRSRDLTVKVGQGRKRSLRIVVSPLPDELQPGIVLTLHDETRLRALEQLRREFVANVSHELKTPLASVKGYAETLLMGALEDPDRARRFVEIISQQSERLELLINDMLRLARAQDAAEVLHLAPVPVCEVIAASMSAYRPVADRKPLDLQQGEIPDDLLVFADRESLLTVVNNLVGNAVRYTQPGGWIRVSAEQTDLQIVIRVHDNGPGIPDSDHDRIFERFYRVEKGRDSQVGGTGLGLAIAKNLVQNMRGQIRLSSRLGEGSCFEVRLPVPNAAGEGSTEDKV